MPSRQANRLPTTAEKLGTEPSHLGFYWLINTPVKKSLPPLLFSAIIEVTTHSIHPKTQWSGKLVTSMMN